MEEHTNSLKILALGKKESPKAVGDNFCTILEPIPKSGRCMRDWTDILPLKPTAIGGSDKGTGILG
jgi:hypothetical protein